MRQAPDTLRWAAPWKRIRDGPHSWAGGFFLHVTDRLYAIDPANGQVVWKSTEVPFKAVVASPDWVRRHPELPAARIHPLVGKHPEATTP